MIEKGYNEIVPHRHFYQIEWDDGRFPVPNLHGSNQQELLFDQIS